jgi:hypothetical protein
MVDKSERPHHPFLPEGQQPSHHEIANIGRTLFNDQSDV